MIHLEFKAQVDLPHFEKDDKTTNKAMEVDYETEKYHENKENFTPNDFMTSLQNLRDFPQKTGASQEICHSLRKMECIGIVLKTGQEGWPSG